MIQLSLLLLCRLGWLSLGVGLQAQFVHRSIKCGLRCFWRQVNARFEHWSTVGQRHRSRLPLLDIKRHSECGACSRCDLRLLIGERHLLRQFAQTVHDVNSLRSPGLYVYDRFRD